MITDGFLAPAALLEPGTSLRNLEGLMVSIFTWKLPFPVSGISVKFVKPFMRLSGRHRPQHIYDIAVCTKERGITFDSLKG
jgi:hypothetical protein